MKKQVGFLAVLHKYGKDAFTWTVRVSFCGCQADVQTRIDAWERHIIAQNGGVMRSMTQPMQQTFNIMPGGKNATGDWWAAVETMCALKWTLFQHELCTYIALNGDAMVPVSFVCSNGYPLGKRVHQVRSSHSMLANRPDETDRRRWLESVGFSWQSHPEVRVERLKRSLEVAFAKPEVLQASYLKTEYHNKEAFASKSSNDDRC